MWPPDLIALEAAYQAIAAIDAVQTAHIAPPHYEAVLWPVIGREPKPAAVAAWFGGMALGHLLLTGALKRWGPPGAARAFEFLSIGCEGGTVAWNINLGIAI